MSSDANAQNNFEEILPTAEKTFCLPTATRARTYQIGRSIRKLRACLKESESDSPAPQAGTESELPLPEVETLLREFATRIADIGKSVSYLEVDVIQLKQQVSKHPQETTPLPPIPIQEIETQPTQKHKTAQKEELYEKPPE